MEPGLVGAGRNAEDVSRLRVAEAEVVMDDQDGPLVGGQATERAVDPIAGVDTMAVSGVDWQIDVVDADLDASAAADTRGLLVAHPDRGSDGGHASKRRVPEGTDVQPSAYEGVLRGVASLLAIVQHQRRCPVEARD